MEGHLITRAQIKLLPKDISVYLERYQEPEKQVTINEPPNKKRGTCWLCGKRTHSSASKKCDKCAYFVCKTLARNQQFARSVSKKNAANQA